MNKLLEVKNLKKYFGGVHAVDGCSFEAELGKITALIGPNGSGKSTVFNLISGILKLDSGQIVFDKEDISKLSVENRFKAGISRVFQHARLFNNLTVRENLLLGLEQDTFNLSRNAKISADEKKIQDILADFKLESKAHELVAELSYGQKRLVEIARSFISPHKILLLDEPVAGVNPILKGEIASFLRKIREMGETVLIVEHDMNFVYAIADEIIVMDAGEVIAKGSVGEIRMNQRVKEAYLGE